MRARVHSPIRLTWRSRAVTPVIIGSVLVALLSPSLLAQDGQREEVRRGLVSDEAKRQSELRSHGQFLLLALPEQRPTVMEYLFSRSFAELELTDQQIEAISEKGKQLLNALEEASGEEALGRQGAGRVISVIQRMALNSPEKLRELRATSARLREEARSELLPHQLDLLVDQALRHRQLGAIRYEEVAELIGFSEAQRDRLFRGIQEIDREFLDEASPKLPPVEVRKALKAAGVTKIGGERTEGQLESAQANRELKLLILVNDVFRPEQLQEIERLVKRAQDTRPTRTLGKIG